MSETQIDWYERRDELRAGMIFNTSTGAVMLVRRVPGDGTKWYVADWDGGWAHYDGTIEPGELLGEPMTEKDFRNQPERTSRPSWLEGGAEAVAMAKEDAKYSMPDPDAYYSIGALTGEEDEDADAPRIRP